MAQDIVERLRQNEKTAERQDSKGQSGKPVKLQSGAKRHNNKPVKQGNGVKRHNGRAAEQRSGKSAERQKLDGGAGQNGTTAERGKSAER